MHHFFYFFEKAIPKGFTNKTIERKLVGRLKILKNNAEVRKHEEIAMVLVELNDLTEPLVKVNPAAQSLLTLSNQHNKSCHLERYKTDV